MRTLILGAFGQDGIFLTQYLSDLGWPVKALGRTVGPPKEVPPNVEVGILNITDADAFSRIVEGFEPEVVINLAAISSVAHCWREPELALSVNGTSVYGLLERIREFESRNATTVRFIQAGSSEMFGGSQDTFVTGSTTPRPVSPYGLSKAIGHEAVRIHRNAYGAFRTNVVMYNHESNLRPEHYLTRRVSMGVARIAVGLRKDFTLQRLDVVRDWGSAREYAEAIARIAILDFPGDYVVATGKSTTLSDLLANAFDEVGICDWQSCVRLDSSGARPVEPAPPHADPSGTWERLLWRPELDSADVIRAMVRSDFQRLADDLASGTMLNPGK